METVYINSSHENNKAGSSFNVPARQYAGTGEFIRIYAVDTAGNSSNTIVINNSFYVEPTSAPVMPSPDDNYYEDIPEEESEESVEKTKAKLPAA